MIIIKGQLPSLNEYTKACRTHHIVGARMKKDAEQYVSMFLKKSDPVPGKVYINFKWYEPNKKRDLDNIAFAKKFILDALVSNEIIQGDGWSIVTGFTDIFEIDKNNPRIEVEIVSVKC